jgi:gamma-glutamyltranspeptidase/glutathione hydrolase
MLSSMTPAIVAKDGKLVLVTGSPGGRTIINTVFSVVFGVVEYGLTGREAVDLARIHHQWLPDNVSFEKQKPPSPEVLERLKAMGHSYELGARQGDAHSIWVAADGTVYGVKENRTSDGKASVPGLTSAAPSR